jgi:hypothetical protein
MALVSMDPALFTIMGAYAFREQGDRVRVAAQIVTSIGFLGAGAIGGTPPVSKRWLKNADLQCSGSCQIVHSGHTD